jgi:hypothetical protein
MRLGDSKRDRTLEPEPAANVVVDWIGPNSGKFTIDSGAGVRRALRAKQLAKRGHSQ